MSVYASSVKSLMLVCAHVHVYAHIVACSSAMCYDVLGAAVWPTVLMHGLMHGRATQVCGACVLRATQAWGCHSMCNNLVATT